ncbi:hypothetical protein PWP93_36325 [Paraburkholderia sp. A1RI-2L]|uniref:hypothetical protein n=1 Tax=Paraburkholderia sp. A1RI-2L TaxID=3028367 RepID=UPI003B785B12
MEIISVTKESDGSAWTACVKLRGVLFIAAYVDNRLTVRLGPYKHTPRRPRWLEGAVREWAEKQVAGIEPEWMDKHRVLYAA